MNTLGTRIAHYRKLKGLSQQALANECGWESQSRIGNYERDTREPSFDDLRRIAKALGVSLNDLLTPAMQIAESEEGRYDPEERLSPRSRQVLDRLTLAASQGRLVEQDLILLEQIARRLEKPQDE
ncbi:helix-turn-helix domain-containing protein [Metapseudomonas furukawaii]|uniref:CI protein n=1 Tax=Metapseudomonas furukawaii TaxID=1149133 RepID=A0AAD1BZU1_METFU|nr:MULTISPECIES: helix-turn-helix transcriptional regulator [Pseudomonas]ELS24153.1 putative phage repressor [Pseudomonas furukawaii]OWJ91592.1 transcriptional regulator [Pseudomonas sp. A46]BAU74929.1 cI protein [Pseudomonas furukawaii]